MKFKLRKCKEIESYFQNSLAVLGFMKMLVDLIFPFLTNICPLKFCRKKNFVKIKSELLSRIDVHQTEPLGPPSAH